MIETIRLDRILQGAVATPYRDLVTRSTGAAVRNGVEEAMRRARCICARLDFSSVGLLDFSCADEVVAKLLLNGAYRGEQYVLLTGLSDDHIEAIDHVLMRHALVVAAVREGGAPLLLGNISDDARRAFDLIYRGGPTDAAGLARSLGWPGARTADALQALVFHRLVQARDGAYLPLPLQ